MADALGRLNQSTAGSTNNSDPDLDSVSFLRQDSIQSDQTYAGAGRQSFTFCAVLSGLLVGLLINVSDTHYGLRIGAGSQMSMVSGLLGYAASKLFSRYTAKQFTSAENVLLVSVATATGCMLLTAGLIAAISALEYIIGPDENGPLHIGFGSLVLWSTGLCFFGIIFTALLREHFIEQERLPWPGPSATSHVINTLHRTKPKRQPDYAIEQNVDCRTARSQDDHVRDGEIEWKTGMNSLLQGTIASGMLVRSIYVYLLSEIFDFQLVMI